jgi:hypothetical protein
MGADKNSSRRRLKLRRDELARSDPQNHTLRIYTFRLPKPHSQWSATCPRNKHHQQPQHTRTHDSGNNSKAGYPEGGGWNRYGGWLDRLHQATKKSSETPLLSTKTYHGFTNRDLWSGPCKLPENLGENQNSTKGPRGGLTSCTQQQTPNKPPSKLC